MTKEAGLGGSENPPFLYKSLGLKPWPGQSLELRSPPPLLLQIQAVVPHLVISVTNYDLLANWISSS